MADEITLGREYATMRSSLAFHCHQAARVIWDQYALRLPVTELEDISNMEGVMKDAPLALLFQLTRFSPAPRAPRYTVAFNIGIKVKEDSGGAKMTKLFDALHSLFHDQRRLQLQDLAEEVAGPGRGTLLINATASAPQQWDKQHTLRWLTVYGNAVVVPAQ